MNKRTILLLATILAVSGSAIGAVPQPNTDQRAVVRGSTAFALDLYARLASKPGNLFFSPYSISSALAMTYGGASGPTAEEMAKTLHFNIPPKRLHASFGRLTRSLNEGGKKDGEVSGPTADKRAKALHFNLPPKRLHAGFGSLTRSLNEGGKKGGYSLSVANALWGQQGTAFLAPFLNLVQKEYGAGLKQLDFKKDAEGARAVINSWVSQETRGKIMDLIAPGGLDATTRLVLTNAIYFKGKWALEFKKNFTKPNQPFYVKEGKEVKVPLMTQTKHYGYFETESFQVLEMPYQGKDVAMVVLLPREKHGLDALEQQLSVKNMQDWLGRLRPREVEVYFPRFKMTRECRLAQELKALGMSDAFNKGKADFSLMNGRRFPDPETLYISDVIHKAFVEVDEEGTEAAAATAVGMFVGESAPPQPPVFRADHPFLFLIRDLHSGAILFLGRVVEPT